MKSIIQKTKGMKKFVFLLLAIPFMISCEIQDDFSYEPSVGPDTGKYDGTGWDYINNAPESQELSLMKEAIILTKTQDLFSQQEMRTFIVPRDAAFKSYLTTNGYQSLADVPVADLKEVLKYHIAKGYYYTADPQYMKKNDPIEFKTEGTDPMLLSHNGNFQVLVNETTKKSFTIYISNIRPTNGVLHISSDVVYYKK